MTSLLAAEGVSWKFRKEADATRTEVMEPRREMEDLREKAEGLRRGEYGVGEPGWTFAIHAVIAEVVAERRLTTVGGVQGAAGILDWGVNFTLLGGEGRGWVGRFF